MSKDTRLLYSVNLGPEKKRKFSPKIIADAESYVAYWRLNRTGDTCTWFHVITFLNNVNIHAYLQKELVCLSDSDLQYFSSSEPTPAIAQNRGECCCYLPTVLVVFLFINVLSFVGMVPLTLVSDQAENASNDNL